jgi:hypothetical protein
VRTDVKELRARRTRIETAPTLASTEWHPRKLDAAIVAVLEDAGTAGLETWAAVAREVNKRFNYSDDPGTVRSVGSRLCRRALRYLARRGTHPRVNPTITPEGSSWLRMLGRPAPDAHTAG